MIVTSSARPFAQQTASVSAPRRTGFEAGDHVNARPPWMTLAVRNATPPSLRIR